MIDNTDPSLQALERDHLGCGRKVSPDWLSDFVLLHERRDRDSQVLDLLEPSLSTPVIVNCFSNSLVMLETIEVLDVDGGVLGVVSDDAVEASWESLSVVLEVDLTRLLGGRQHGNTELIIWANWDCDDWLRTDGEGEVQTKLRVCLFDADFERKHSGSGRDSSELEYHATQLEREMGELLESGEVYLEGTT